MQIKKILKILLLLLLFTAITAATVFLFFLVPLLEQFNDLISGARMDIESGDCLENLTLLFPIYTYRNEPFEVEHFDLRPGSSKNYSISIVETEYGKMWKIEIRRLNRSGGIVFNHPYNVPLDLFDIKLKPVLNESVIKDEQRGRYYEKVVNLTVPVYIYYEGNVTEVNVKLIAESGLDNLLGLLPVAPKHNGRVYAGMREDVFLIDFKGWGSAVGTSKIDVTYQ